MSSARKRPTRPASTPLSGPVDSPVPKTPAPDVSLEVQLKCAQRELAMRKNVYPQWITAGRMNKFKAEDEIAAMGAIVRTLQGLVDGRK